MLEILLFSSFLDITKEVHSRFNVSYSSSAVFKITSNSAIYAMCVGALRKNKYLNHSINRVL